MTHKSPKFKQLMAPLDIYLITQDEVILLSDRLEAVNWIRTKDTL